MKIEGKIVDIRARRIFDGVVHINNGIIQDISEEAQTSQRYILPGFIDSHIHIESSMLVPSEFARIAVQHGTVATVSDPHEIANVLGIDGVNYMIENGKKTPFKFNFGAPSCVPATSFETAGAVIDSDGIRQLLENPEIKYLAEMMNYPGVIFDDVEVVKKINWAKHFGKPVDGHAPGLRGEELTKYIGAGISTDHECFTYEEGLEKLQKGMKVLIREGSAAKNFEALHPLIPDHFEHMMFCSDDKHPDDLLLGHINELCARAVGEEYDLFNILQMACINPVEHYNLDVGTLKIGDKADFIIVEDLTDFEVIETYINGERVYGDGDTKFQSVPVEIVNNFDTELKLTEDFRIASEAQNIRVIEAHDGELITSEFKSPSRIVEGNMISDIDNDILKMTVVNRYSNQKPALAFIKNIGLKHGAIASSVAHDSHNIVAVGVDDDNICKAVNALVKSKGGICVVSDDVELIMPLPVAGLMSDKDAETVGKLYSSLDQSAKQLGSNLRAPFMTLSFMALLVIPSLKLSDKGLFDGNSFQFTPLELT